ncbi:MAG TPA: aldehyde dehydrogenase family protein [Solirubrobacteraceae bacterium]|nr:aldehyde dehydrogenase family protein [Solirubrobacteraceae bacterium]
MGTLTARDPATGARLGEVRGTAPEAVAELVAGAAKVQPLWALLQVRDRARYMARMAQATIDAYDELLERIAREQGRPRAEVAALELLPAIEALRWMAQDGAKVLGGRRVGSSPSLGPMRARIAYEPYGVVAVIGAGSAPFAQPLGQIAGALLAGNGVVFKPAARAWMAGEAIAGLLARAGLPEGLVAVAHGGSQTGIALGRAQGVGKLLFTGSPAVGRALAREAVTREKEVTVELGGKDAMLVLADADLAKAVDCALWAGCAGAGQARGAVERIFVEEEIAQAFTELLVERARTLRVGDPADPRTQVGPLASRRRLERVMELTGEAVEQGAELRCGGPLAAPGDCTGTFYAPAVLSGAQPRMRAMREPLDAPVLAVASIDSVEQGVELVNDCDYGLGASVWTADRYRGARIARDLRAGMVWINDHLPAPTLARGPWGAAAGGGLGKTLGETGLRACAQEKLIAWSPQALRGPWWGPYDATSARAARTAAKLRSARGREQALRQGSTALARMGARMLGRGVPR